MLGVVLWSDSSDRKAVIWCEDQGDLAFVTEADASGSVLQHGDFFDAGDLVHFDMKICNSTRRACNARIVAEQAGRDLPHALRRETMQGSNEGAKVIPFSASMRCGPANLDKIDKLTAAVGE